MTVEVDDVDEEEFERCMLFRGMNICDTSSAFMEPRGVCPLLEEYHPRRGADCTLGGEATAVMRKGVEFREASCYTE